MAPGPLLACVVEQSLSDVLPGRFWPVEADGIGLLDLDGPGTPARDTLRICWEISDSRSRRAEGRPSSVPASASGSSMTACQYSGGISSPGPGVRIGTAFSRTATAAAASFSICFGVGMRQLAGRSVMAAIRTYQEHRSRVRPWSKSEK
jgi:hypothetical protein